MKLTILKNKFSIFIIALFLSLVFSFFTKIEFFQEIEYKITDSKFTTFTNPNNSDSSVVLVTIDDSSIKHLSQNGISFPWPRIFYAEAVNYLTDAGAKAVMFDMQFYENDIDRSEISSSESDNSFASSISKAGNVYLGSQLNSDKRFNFSKLDKITLTINGEYSHHHIFEGFIPPIKVLRDSCIAYNPLNILPDSDGVFRRIPLFYNFQERYLPQAPLKILSNLLDIPTINIKKNIAKIDELKIPLDQSGNYFINWYSKDTFVNYPFKAVLSSASAIKYGNEPTLKPELFKDKIIIIGSTAAGLMDDRTTPLSKNISGLDIWATIISNYLQKDFTSNLKGFYLFLLFLFISTSVLFSLIKFKSRLKYFNILLLLIIVLFDYYLWIKFRTIGELFLSLLIFFVSFLIGILINIFLEEKDKRIIKGMFGKYLSPELIEQLIKDPSKLKLGGEEKNISVLFTDIYNFTDLSENTSPIQIVDNLNGYLKGITGFVIANKGYLDKFTGDGIMALFGAPEPYDNHAFWACKTAIKYKNFYTSFSKNDLSIASNRFHTQTRIAIHSGKTVSGNIGSSAKMNYTAIGDTVNLSARLEAINKIYQTNIIVSQDTYELVKTDFLFRELDTIKVKGRESATTIYELIDFYEEKPVWIASYEKGLDEYRNKRWEKAANIFQQLIKSHNDPPSKELLKRCHKLIKNNPQNWNSTFKLYTK